MHKNLSDHISALQRIINRHQRNIDDAARLLGPLDLSESADFNFYGDDLWVVAKERSDVEKVLALAPAGVHWIKSPIGEGVYGEGAICYSLVVEGCPTIKLHAMGAALPPTCRIVEEVVTVPAQPERQEVRRVLKCTEPQPEQAAEVAPQAAAEGAAP